MFNIQIPATAQSPEGAISCAAAVTTLTSSSSSSSATNTGNAAPNVVTSDTIMKAKTTEELSAMYDEILLRQLARKWREIETAGDVATAPLAVTQATWPALPAPPAAPTPPTPPTPPAAPIAPIAPTLPPTTPPPPENEQQLPVVQNPAVSKFIDVVKLKSLTNLLGDAGEYHYNGDYVRNYNSDGKKICASPGCKKLQNHIGLCSGDELRTTNTGRRCVDMKRKNCDTAVNDDDKNDKNDKNDKADSPVGTPLKRSFDPEKDTLSVDPSVYSSIARAANKSGSVKAVTPETPDGPPRTLGAYVANYNGSEYIGAHPASSVELYIDGSYAINCCAMTKEMWETTDSFTFDTLVNWVNEVSPCTYRQSPMYVAEQQPPPFLVGRQCEFMEFFCGTAVLSKAVLGVNPNALVWTLDNITKPDVKQDTHIQDSFLESMFDVSWRNAFSLQNKWFGFPCQTFSRAGCGTHGRTLANMWLGKSKEAKEANFMLRYIVSVLRFMLDLGKEIGTFTFENPDCVFLNHPMVRLMLRGVAEGGLGASVVRVSYCAFGTSWQKNTVLITNSKRVIEFFSGTHARCSGKGVCCFSNQAHVTLGTSFVISDEVLECRSALGGTTEKKRRVDLGVPAKNASQYPDKFCKAMAELFFSAKSIASIRKKYVLKKTSV